MVNVCERNGTRSAIRQSHSAIAMLPSAVQCERTTRCGETTHRSSDTIDQRRIVSDTNLRTGHELGGVVSRTSTSILSVVCSRSSICTSNIFAVFCFFFAVSLRCLTMCNTHSQYLDCIGRVCFNIESAAPSRGNDIFSMLQGMMGGFGGARE